MQKNLQKKLSRLVKWVIEDNGRMTEEWNVSKLQINECSMSLFTWMEPRRSKPHSKIFNRVLIFSSKQKKFSAIEESFDIQWTPLYTFGLTQSLPWQIFFHLLSFILFFTINKWWAEARKEAEKRDKWSRWKINSKHKTNFLHKN